jgi:hypothetical protein
MTLHRYTTIALAALALAACGDDDDTVSPATQPAHVRVVNASAATSSANVYVGTNTTALGTAVATGAGSGSCVDVAAGSQTLNFRQAGGTSTVATAPAFSFTAGQNYTAILTGSTTANRNAFVLSDNGATAPATGQNAIRFVNATGAAADIYVTTPGAALGTASQTALANNASTSGGTGGFSTYPTGNVQVRAFTAGTTTGTPTVTYTIPSLTGNRIATIVLTGGAAGSQAFVVTPCS